MTRTLAMLVIGGVALGLTASAGCISKRDWQPKPIAPASSLSEMLR